MEHPAHRTGEKMSASTPRMASGSTTVMDAPPGLFKVFDCVGVHIADDKLRPVPDIVPRQGKPTAPRPCTAIFFPLRESDPNKKRAPCFTAMWAPWAVGVPVGPRGPPGPPVI